MATHAVKVKNEESGSNAITGAAAGIGQRISGTVADTREFMHDVRVEMKQVTWPSKDDVLFRIVFGRSGLASAARGGLRLQNLWCLKGIRLRWRCSGTSSIPTRALRRKSKKAWRAAWPRSICRTRLGAC